MSDNAHQSAVCQPLRVTGGGFPWTNTFKNVSFMTQDGSKLPSLAFFQDRLA